VEEQEQRQTISQAQPELLYHYTTQEGLLGILKSRSIWASHIRFLNDTSEGKIFLGAFTEILEEMRKNNQKSKGEYSKISTPLKIYRARADIKNLVLSLDIYAASFTRDGDLLGQWRAYSGNAGGFSIGFSGVQLNIDGKEFILDHGNQFYHDESPLQQCLYKDLRTIFPELKEAADSAALLSAEPVQKGSLTTKAGHGRPITAAQPEDLLFRIAKAASITKHDSFRQEQEWRIAGQSHLKLA
jgi:hypothetical protein